MDVINTAYKEGIKREIVNALKPIFGNDFPIENLRNKVYVGLEYPMKPIQYPAIYVTFSEREIRNVGVGHVEDGFDDAGTPFISKRFSFIGSVNFNIIALNPLERDQLASALVNILAFGQTIPQFKPFFDRLLDGQYVDLTLMTERITPGGEQVGDTPWESEDQRQYGNSYSVEVFGEFESDQQTGDLVQIGGVVVTPYRTDQEPPWTD